MPANERVKAFGDDYQLSAVDRLGNWLSQRAMARVVGDVTGKRVADIGSGFNARLLRPHLGRVRHATIVDVTLADDLKRRSDTTCIEGWLPEALSKIADASQDVVMCISVLEHVWEDTEMLAQLRRMLAPEGVLVLNVPSWLGKRALEFNAFRLGWTPREEIDDHKRYYDPRDLWPMLVRAGFAPSSIDCHRHKLGLNTLAICRAERRPNEVT